jgi:peptidoglycan hydrolase-like protein with peptidoglycan-binding domain
MLKNKLFAGAIFALALFVAGTVSAAYSFPNKIDTLQEKKDVQTVLNMNGANLTVDGILGAKSISAVKTFQGSKGLEADGLIGPMTRAALEAASVAGSTVSTVPGCAAGALFSATSGAACTTVSSTVPGCTAGALFSATTGASCATGVVTTPGTPSAPSEGYMTLQSAPVALTSSVGPSDTQVAISAFAVKATDSDIKVQRVNVSVVPSASALPWKYFTNLSLYQDNTLLATLPVSSTSLTENSFGLDYTAVFSGFNATVFKNSTSSFIVKADVVSTIPTTLPAVTFSIGLKPADVNAVRGVDSIGLSQYVGPADANTSYYKIVSFGATSAGVVKVVSNGSNPIQMNVVTSTTTTTTGLTALVLDIQNTSKYNETIKSITATIADNTTVSGYYLYDGATMVASLGNPSTDNVGTSTLSFINLPSSLTVSANSVKTLSVKYDAAMNGTGTVNVTIPVLGITAVDANSNLVASSGAATGNNQIMQSTGVVVNLNSATATSVASTSGVAGYATGTFVFKVKANGVNLAKLSTGTNFVPTVTANGTALAAGAVTFQVSPDTAVSDGSEVTVTVTAVKSSTIGVASFVKFAITNLVFVSDAIGGTTTVNTGLDNFYTNSIPAN